MRRSQRIRNVQERHLSTANDPFWVKEESTLLLAFSHLRVHELLRCAITSKAWRKCIDHNAIAWTTAMWELDPLAVLGPKGAKEAVARLKVEGCGCNGVHGKYWLALARRLASPWCAGEDDSCEVRGFEFNPLTLTRLCVECKQDLAGYSPDEASEYTTLINDFIFDKEPSVQVHTAKELHDAMKSVHEGGCIEVVGVVNLSESDARELVRRVAYDPLHYRYRICGCDGARIVSEYSTIYLNCCILQNLIIEVGYGDGWGETYFPALEIDDEAHLLLKDCNVYSNNGTALMITNGGRASVDGGRLSSNDMFLGIVLKNEIEGGALPVVSCRGCSFKDNQWGCFLTKNIDEKIVKSFMAVNTFADYDGVTRMYEYRNAEVQPWRRGWATEER